MSSPFSTARFHILVGSRVTLPSNKWALMILKETRPQDNPPASCGTSFSPTADNGRLSLPTPGSLVLKGRLFLDSPFLHSPKVIVSFLEVSAVVPWQYRLPPREARLWEGREHTGASQESVSHLPTHQPGATCVTTAWSREGSQMMFST